MSKNTSKLVVVELDGQPVSVPGLPKIEKGIPLPPIVLRNTGDNVLKQTEVGDSVFYAVQQGKDLKHLRGRIAYLTKHAKPFVFTSRTVTENKQDGIRVWRIAPPAAVK